MRTLILSFLICLSNGSELNQVIKHLEKDVFKLHKTCEVVSFGLVDYDIFIEHPILNLDKKTLQTIQERGTEK